MNDGKGLGLKAGFARCASALALCLLFLATPAGGILLFETGFETSDHAGYAAGSPLAGFDGWASIQNPEGTTRDGEMITSSGAAFSGSQSGRIYGNIGGVVSTIGQTRWRMSLDALVPNSALGPGEFVRWEFVAMVPEEEAGLWLYTTSGTSFATYGVSLRHRTTGAADVNDSVAGNPVIAPAGSLVPGTWYRWTIDLFLNADTPNYSVLIEDTSNPAQSWSLADIPFRATQTGIRSLLFMNTDNNEGGYIDDMRLSIIPEPSSLLLFGLAALGLALRRRT